MGFILGIDGGASKTMAVIGDQEGHVLGIGLSGPSNYQITGLDMAMKSISDAVKMAAAHGDIELQMLDFAVFGLAGADFPIDFENLTKGIQDLYPWLKFEIVNDTWVGFRSGTDADHGGVVIAGTGANFAAKAPDGRKITGRGMGYEWGGQGGAGNLIRDAMHFAFRSHDGTGPKTMLEEAVLSTLGFQSYDDLSLYMYQVQSEFAHIYVKAAEIVPQVFMLASQGDQVCIRILIDLGISMGEIIGMMIKTLGTQDLEQDIVMAGGLFAKGENPLLIDSLSVSCHRFVPFARFKIPDIEPAGGAYILGLEKLGIDAKGKVRERAIRTFCQLADSLR